MNNAVTKVAVVGSGSESLSLSLSLSLFLSINLIHFAFHYNDKIVSGAVCASTLARNGVSVTVFESARGPGGRMSQRREISEDGKELLFDHGAPFFTVSNADVLALVREWESGGLVAEWKVNFGSYDCISKKFVDVQENGTSKKYVGVPGMNSICKTLCYQPGVESKFGVGVGRLEWLVDEKLWSVTGLDGQSLGHFKGAVASDKNVVSPRFRRVMQQPPPLGMISLFFLLLFVVVVLDFEAAGNVFRLLKRTDECLGICGYQKESEADLWPDAAGNSSRSRKRRLGFAGYQKREVRVLAGNGFRTFRVQRRL
ncbi:hypothetical protein JRO89_XS15G0058500 [Xanthoceras sorbifolium]|uniref:Amine oxidase domain-containing protein n=1 Tax=Xanthoceras sorbifolium TaxID=99658 RepID=A0ABQ8H124_9ROSI|nr:hypothetical protein JRO89_XS15G0058500 [Xanthoceras sorbifolium]